MLFLYLNVKVDPEEPYGSSGSIYILLYRKATMP
nr:MAG TPA: hypothetical protein [Caudoviricetes sp.]